MFNRLWKSFSMVALAIGLFGQSLSAFGQTAIVVLEHPSHGALKFMPDGTGIVYLGNGELDRFSFATIDDEGFALTEIDIDCSYGHDMATLDFGGPLPLFPLTWKLTPEQPVSLQGNNVEDDGYVVIVRVDQPGAGGDRRPYRGGPIKGIAVGHTFVEVIDGSTGQSTTAGFYPTTGTTPWDPQSPRGHRQRCGT
ncbi:MAG TPA: hypothetical protein PKA76_19380 [Pirellulaceae bacterium]|nr:hypothetical protein [Pirellulaceae bacterium]